MSVQARGVADCENLTFPPSLHCFPEGKWRLLKLVPSECPTLFRNDNNNNN